MKDLTYGLKELCNRNRDGSYATQYKRFRILSQCAYLLHEIGYRKMGTQSLKPKHVDALVKRWKADNLSVGTIKNNMTSLRWWAQKIGKPAIIARDNDYYGIEKRVFVTGTDKSCQLDADKLSKVADPYVKASLELQEAFGLRREESIKFTPIYAMQSLEDGYIQLKDTWTKGGKPRNVPITEAMREKQMQALKNAATLAGRGSLIPPDKRYVNQLKTYERHTRNAGFNKLHGLRHAYAQARYTQLTGMEPPCKGGPSPRSMMPELRERDHAARDLISKELGHERRQIVSVYLGG